MRQKPREFLFLAIALFMIGISLPIQVMVMFDQSVLETPTTLNQLAPLNWLVMALALLNAALVYQASPWVMVMGPLFLCAVSWNNWLVADAALNYSPWTAVCGVLGAFALHTVLLTERARKILRNPTLRWWRSMPRKKVAVKAVVCPVLGGEMQSMTFDISLGGAFISGAHSRWRSQTQPMPIQLEVGSRCSIRLMLDQVHVVSCSAEVVRQAPARGNYPGGFALRFVNLDGDQKRVLSGFLKSVKSAGTEPMAAAA